MGKQITTYYTSLEHLGDVYDKVARKMPAPVDSKDAFLKWQKDARQKLHELLSLDQYDYCEPIPKVLESTKFDGYRRDTILIRTEQDIFVPMYVLVPETLNEGERRPAVIIPPGHGPGRFFTVEDMDYDGMAYMEKRIISIVGKYEPRPNFAKELVKKGYIVFVPDSRGDGERREYMDQGMEGEKFVACSHRSLNNVAIALGQSVLGMIIWDWKCLCNYILSRNDSDGRIAVGGLSGGGMQSLYLAAVDERIQCAVTSGWFYGYKESFVMQPQNCGCNFVPQLWRYFDCCDIGSLVAPRPLHIESGIHDHLNGHKTGIDNVYTQVNQTEKSYNLFGASNNLVHYVHPGRHEWDGGEVYNFLDMHYPVKLRDAGEI